VEEEEETYLIKILKGKGLKNLDAKKKLRRPNIHSVLKGTQR